MKTTIFALATVLALSGCASVVHIPEPEDAQVVVNTNKEFNTLPAPATGPVVAAVYGFTDKTGQRKPSEKMANISFAVTQGAEVWVIKALQEVGQGQWFKVVERVGLDNLTKERQIIRQARESVGDQRQLKPMMFAGIIIEGGIIGYDSNTLTGGAGARYLGIGASTQYRQDVVTVTMRATSVQTGEVLLSVSTTKTIISTGSSFTVFKFFDVGTKSLETEVGNSINEPVNYAVRAAIEQAVVEMVKEGGRKGLWAFKSPVAEKQEVKVEEKKEVVVQPQPNVSAPVISSEVKKEEPAPVADLKPVVSKQELKVEPKAVFGQRKLKEAEFIYKEPNDKSQKTWMFKKGAVVNVVQSGSEGWVRVVDSERRGGWIQIEQMEEIKQ
jgi:curli production assembly/transport component CsgG